jgi:hypothetical protein
MYLGGDARKYCMKLYTVGHHIRLKTEALTKTNRNQSKTAATVAVFFLSKTDQFSKPNRTGLVGFENLECMKF